MTTPTTNTESKNYKPGREQYFLPELPFDGYDKEQPVKSALGSARIQSLLELGAIASVNFAQSAKGWRLTPLGLELNSFDFPDDSISSTSIAGLTEASQDAVGAMVDASLTYADGTPLLGVTAAYRRKSLFDHYTDGATTHTDGTEDNLYSDTTAAGQLAANGEKIEAEYGGVFVSSATATRKVKVYFGGTAIFDTGDLTLSLSSAWTAYVTLIRVSATVIRYMVSFTTEGAALAAYTSVGELTGLTLSGTNVLKITGAAAGADAAASDIVAKVGTVNWLAAA